MLRLREINATRASQPGHDGDIWCMRGARFSWTREGPGMGRHAVVVAMALVMALATVAKAEMSVEQRLRVLEQQLREAQDEIKRLRGEVQQGKAVDQAIQKQVEQVDQATKAPGIVETVKASLPDWLRSITLFGDVRVRYDGQFHQPTSTGTKATANNQSRLRARVGLKYTFSDELAATIR